MISLAQLAVMGLLTHLLIELLYETHTSAWQMTQVGLNESYKVRHLSTYYNRVFLSISVESKAFPTLVESQWPASYLPQQTDVFPHRSMHSNGVHTNCRLIHQSRWSQVDSLGRLWVMDMGWQDNVTLCAPKLLVFDLIRQNAEVLHIDCGRYIKPTDDKSLVIKMGPKPSPCQVQKFIYFVLLDEPYLLAYDIIEQVWYRHKLVSEKYSNVKETFPIKPTDFVFDGKNELIVADEDGLLYSSRTNAIHLEHEGTHNALRPPSLELKLLGSLLGPSKSMLVDHTGALFYAVPRFGAIVRCAYKQNLTAEGNEIIYMTAKNIQQIFFGREGSVWLLTDRVLKPQDHCFQAF